MIDDKLNHDSPPIGDTPLLFFENGHANGHQMHRASGGHHFPGELDELYGHGHTHRPQSVSSGSRPDSSGGSSSVEDIDEDDDELEYGPGKWLAAQLCGTFAVCRNYARVPPAPQLTSLFALCSMCVCLGIVDKLRSKFLRYSMKTADLISSNHGHLKRCSSLENILDNPKSTYNNNNANNRDAFSRRPNNTTRIIGETKKVNGSAPLANRPPNNNSANHLNNANTNNQINAGQQQRLFVRQFVTNAAKSASGCGNKLSSRRFSGVNGSCVAQSIPVLKRAKSMETLLFESSMNNHASSNAANNTANVIDNGSNTAPVEHPVTGRLPLVANNNIYNHVNGKSCPPVSNAVAGAAAVAVASNNQQTPHGKAVAAGAAAARCKDENKPVIIEQHSLEKKPPLPARPAGLEVPQVAAVKTVATHAAIASVRDMTGSEQRRGSDSALITGHNDPELPKPDTVKNCKKIFEPADTCTNSTTNFNCRRPSAPAVISCDTHSDAPANGESKPNAISYRKLSNGNGISANSSHSTSAIKRRLRAVTTNAVAKSSPPSITNGAAASPPSPAAANPPSPAGSKSPVPPPKPAFLLNRPPVRPPSALRPAPASGPGAVANGGVKSANSKATVVSATSIESKHTAEHNGSESTLEPVISSVKPDEGQSNHGERENAESAVNGNEPTTSTTTATTNSIVTEANEQRQPPRVTAEADTPPSASAAERVSADSADANVVEIVERNSTTVAEPLAISCADSQSASTPSSAMGKVLSGIAKKPIANIKPFSKARDDDDKLSEKVSRSTTPSINGALPTPTVAQANPGSEPRVETAATNGEAEAAKPVSARNSNSSDDARATGHEAVSPAAVTAARVTDELKKRAPSEPTATATSESSKDATSRPPVTFKLNRRDSVEKEACVVVAATARAERQDCGVDRQRREHQSQPLITGAQQQPQLIKSTQSAVSQSQQKSQAGSAAASTGHNNGNQESILGASTNSNGPAPAPRQQRATSASAAPPPPPPVAASSRLTPAITTTSLWSSSNGHSNGISNGSNCMIFNFVGKDVKPSVAIHGTLVRTVDADDDNYTGSTEIPPPCNIVFEGENEIIAGGLLLRHRNKKVSIALHPSSAAAELSIPAGNTFANIIYYCICINGHCFESTSCASRDDSSRLVLTMRHLRACSNTRPRPACSKT